MQPIQRTLTLKERALLHLRKAIVVGELEPGSLHSEQTIATRLGLSRTPIREALLQLAAEGLVVFLPNRGAQIVDLDAGHLAQVLQFRAAIEGCGASRMAARPNRAILAGLDRALKQQETILKEGGERLRWVDANMDFHMLLAEASENDLMIRAYGPLASHTKRLGYKMTIRKDRMQEALDEHRAIVDAIRRGDPDRARTMAEEHLYVTTVLMKQLFDDLGICSGAAHGLKKTRGRKAK